MSSRTDICFVVVVVVGAHIVGCAVLQKWGCACSIFAQRASLCAMGNSHMGVSKKSVPWTSRFVTMVLQEDGRRNDVAFLVQSFWTPPHRWERPRPGEALHPRTKSIPDRRVTTVRAMSASTTSSTSSSSLSSSCRLEPNSTSSSSSLSALVVAEIKLSRRRRRRHHRRHRRVTGYTGTLPP